LDNTAVAPEVHCLVLLSILKDLLGNWVLDLDVIRILQHYYAVEFELIYLIGSQSSSCFDQITHSIDVFAFQIFEDD
jgi:hypothetical protein